MALNPKGARSATLAKGLDILNTLESQREPQSLRSIMSALNMTKPTAHRLLATLVDYGLVRYNSKEATYQLGMRLFEMSHRVWQDFDLRGIASVEMQKLSDLTGEAISLALINGKQGVYIDEIESRHYLREPSRMGMNFDLWRSATGKALIAGIQPEKRESIIQDINPDELAGTRFPSIEQMRAHLDLVNARGYSIDLGDHISGIVGVAAPIVDHRGLTVAAIGLSGPADRLTRERLHELGPALIEATRRASLQAGGSPRPVSKVPPPATPVKANVKTLHFAHNLIGEGPVFDEKNNRLFWVDICRPEIYGFDLKTGQLNAFSVGEMVAALAIVDDGLLIAAQSGLWIVNPMTGERLRDLGHPEKHIPTNRFNDGKCDAKGRFWIGTIALNLAEGAGSLYAVDANGTSRVMETDLTLPNGLGWSPNGKVMYVTDTMQKTIFAYDFDLEEGSISNRRVFITFDANSPANPDGLAVDSNGNLWVAMWDGWCVSKFSPRGEHLEDIAMPVPRPTSCAFGGEDNKTLFVTSARIRVSETSLQIAPLSGSVFAIDLSKQ